MPENTRFHKFICKIIEELVIELDTYLNKLLVRTLVLTLQAVLKFRHNTNGLLLSELGGYILSPGQAPAGTKRISNLLRSPKWIYRIIAHLVWRRADQRGTELVAEGKTALVVWDESVWEKPESLTSEGLCAVRSSKAQRLKLLMMVALVYAFLLSLLAPHLDVLHTWLFRNFAHRTGQRHLQVKMPLYRLRLALSRLWIDFPSSPHFAWQNSR